MVTSESDEILAKDRQFVGSASDVQTAVFVA
jgi:hypothetical protein